MDELVVSLTECTLCTEPMSSPKFLPCFHCFCRKCIEKLCCVHEDGGGGAVPCPLCRATFGAPKGGDCRRLPTNVYAEELVRVSGMVRDASKMHLLVKDELEAVKNELKTSEDERQRAAEERLRQDKELAETRTRLMDRSSHVDELKGILTEAESRETRLLEEQQSTLDKLEAVERSYEGAKIEVESYQKAKLEAEASLAASEESCRNLSEELRQTRQETSEQANSLQTVLGKSTQEIESLKDQLAAMKDQLKHLSALSVFLVAALLAVVFFVMWKRWSADETPVRGYFHLPWSPF